LLTYIILLDLDKWYLGLFEGTQEMFVRIVNCKYVKTLSRT